MRTHAAWFVSAAAVLVLACAPANDAGSPAVEPQATQQTASTPPAKTPVTHTKTPVTEAPANRDPRPGLTVQQKQDLDRYLALAKAAAQADQVDVAVTNFEHVWSLNPNHPYAVMYLKDYYLRRGLELYGDGLLDEAIGVWENALRVSPDDRRVQGYLERARKQVARTQQILDDDH